MTEKKRKVNAEMRRLSPEKLNKPSGVLQKSLSAAEIIPFESAT